MSSVSAFNEEGLLSWSMPSLDDNDGRTCVVNDAAMLTDNQQQQKNERCTIRWFAAAVKLPRKLAGSAQT
jgi:hypothetical protein